MYTFSHDTYRDEYIENEDFKEVFQHLQEQIRIKEGDGKDDYHLQNGLLYKLDKIYVSKGERLQLIRQAHTSKVLGHFGVGKMVANLDRYV
jgi:hypothetical protein